MTIFSLVGNFVDWSRIRGVNYLPMASVSCNLHLAWLTVDGEYYSNTNGGLFYEPHFQQEIDVLAGIGFNTVRLWGSFLSWYMDRDDYISNLKKACKYIRAKGMSVMYCLFNATPAGFAVYGNDTLDIINASNSTFGTTDRTYVRNTIWALSEIWNTLARTTYSLSANDVYVTHWPEPFTASNMLAAGYYGDWSNTAYQTAISDYINDIAILFRDDTDASSAHLIYDLWNEANIVYPNATARTYAVDFMVKVARQITTIHPGAQLTVGWAGAYNAYTTQLVSNGIPLACGSTHGYVYEYPGAAADAQFVSMESNIVQSIQEAISLGLNAIINSEFYVLPENCGQIHRYIDILVRNNTGGTMWCYIRNNAFRAPGSGKTGPTVYDGLVVCSTLPKLITKGQTLSFIPHAQSTSEYMTLADNLADIARIKLWCKQ